MKTVSLEIKHGWNGLIPGTVCDSVEIPRASILVSRGIAEYTGGSEKAAIEASEKATQAKADAVESKEEPKAETKAEPVKPKSEKKAEPKGKAKK